MRKRTLTIGCLAGFFLVFGCVGGERESSGSPADIQQNDAVATDGASVEDVLQSLDGGGVDSSFAADATTEDVSVVADGLGESDANDTSQPTGPPLVTLVTTLGEFTIELNADAAPVTTENFLKYVGEGFYDGDDGLGATTFHRIIKGFMIQGGGVRADMSYKDVHAAIINESTNGLKNLRGSVAMARKNDPDTATSQFFVNHVDNDFLDYADADNPGYAVFGQVITGMDVVDAIAEVPTNPADMPFETIEILNVVQ